jgi:predicted nuclease of restriction endonuclease-like (RecB) superfamily
MPGMIKRRENYEAMLSGVAELLEEARRTSARTVNAILTATYWEIGRRIVEHEQAGAARAGYRTALLKRLAFDLTARFGRGFSRQNIQQMRQFYLGWSIGETGFSKSTHQICQTPSGKSKDPDIQPMPEKLSLREIAGRFPLPWSHYIRLMSVESSDARTFYETESLRNGWSVRQLDRQISTLFFERTALSRNKASMLKKAGKPCLEDAISPEEEIKDPLVLEFLGLKDEYSENDMEEAIIRHLENFLLELGGDFTFVARQRRLRCLVIIDLKLGKFTHADAGQMHMYLNYARDKWTHPDENPPVGLILCAEKSHAVAKYALEGLPNKVLAAEYKMLLPDEKALTAEIEKTHKALETRRKQERGNK